METKIESLMADRNTSCFHKMANSHRKFNYMSSIMVEGSSYNSLENMKPAIQGYYSPLFCEAERWRQKSTGWP